MSFTEPASQLCEHSFARVCLCLQSIHAPLSTLARLNAPLQCWQTGSRLMHACKHGAPAAFWPSVCCRLAALSSSQVLISSIRSGAPWRRRRCSTISCACCGRTTACCSPPSCARLASPVRRRPVRPPRAGSQEGQVDWEARVGGSSQCSAWHGLISLHICKLTVFRAKRDGGLRSSRGRACDSPPPHAKPQHPAGLRLACPEAQLRCGQGPRRRSSARSCAWRPATAAGATTARL